ncbi:MAG: hypothetical protein IKO34_11170 [Bacteroidales bacterium]|nr:hypothetical protein [Bacteroidales bacterium]
MKFIQNNCFYVRFWGVLSMGALLILAACGENSTTEKVVEVAAGGVDVVASVDDLPKCEKDSEGEQILVKGEPTMRICMDGKWFATKESTKDTLFIADDFSCTTKQLKDKSGLKIICNGDSIGVVKNGAVGHDGENGRISAVDDCSISQEGSTMSFTCNGETMRLNVDADGKVSVDTTALDSEKVAVSLDEVTGASQKGPFLSGSKVLVRELQDGRSLVQTGNSFNGKIQNDRGEFKINARTLMSQYVSLVANGYYRNEVTGKNSNSELTLMAITDVLKSKNANINLVTHLEYERVNYLVTKKKYSVKAAKAQAQREVFALFDIDATGFSNSEYLNIAGSSDEDGALLAFSVMLQGDNSVAQLTELLMKIAADMEKDGSWDDSKTRMSVADWAADADSAGRLTTIRDNVKGWNLSSSVPNFEQFVRNFWNTEYGLDSCDSRSEGVVKAATAGKRKGTRTRYICKNVDDLSDMRWVVATDIEKDTYQWKNSTDGALKKGAVTGAKYVFDEIGSYDGTKGWRPAVDVENIYGGCTEALYDSVRSYRGTAEAGYYLCQKSTHKWVLVNNRLMIDTQGWAEGDDGFSKWVDIIGEESGESRVCYVYDTSSSYNGWRSGNDNDCSLELGGCTKGRTGVLTLAADDNYYICENDTWTLVSDKVKINTLGWSCLDSNEAEMKKGLRNDAYFICEKNNWREATTDEELACRNDGLCSACTDDRQGEFVTANESAYICDSKHWCAANCAEKVKKSLCTENDSSLVEACEKLGGFDIDYVCSGGKWHAVANPFEYTLVDWNRKRDAFNEAAVEAGAHADSMITDPRDGKSYRTVVINGKRVFAENLRYVDSKQSVNLKGNMWCYRNEAKNCEIGGVYYTWTAAVDLDGKWLSVSASSLISVQHRGICPEGWHVPSNDEWTALFKNVDYVAQQAMGYSSWKAATDAVGFSALPADLCYRGSCVNQPQREAHFWSSTESSESLASFWNLIENGSYLAANDKDDYAYSVRCIQDDP